MKKSTKYSIWFWGWMFGFITWFILFDLNRFEIIRTILGTFIAVSVIILFALKINDVKRLEEKEEK